MHSTALMQFSQFQKYESYASYSFIYFPKLSYYNQVPRILDYIFLHYIAINDGKNSSEDTGGGKQQVFNWN